MIDYYETKAHPITKKMVWDAYQQIRKNGKAAGVDGVTFDDYEVNLQANLYKLWNRLTSGSYFPQMTREKSIPKSDGGTRSLGIATVEDRTAQQVVRAYLEPLMEPTFHDSSYGYRPKRYAHQAIDAVTKNCFTNHWVLDIDIKGYFDTIDHTLLMKAVERYTAEKWVLMYVERWLKTGVLKEDGTTVIKTGGTAQGSVLSPLLSNVFLHFVFDKWMQKNHPQNRFVRYSDDIVVNCKSEMQAKYLKSMIRRRFFQCKLILNETKTRIVHCKQQGNKEGGNQSNASFDFLSFTLKPRIVMDKNKNLILLTLPAMSIKAKKRVSQEMTSWKLHRKNWELVTIAKFVNERVTGWMNYYCYSRPETTWRLWVLLNRRLLKWIMRLRKWRFRRAIRWLKMTYKMQPNLFAHWAIARP